MYCGADLLIIISTRYYIPHTAAHKKYHTKKWRYKKC
nr:MAG TPA: hypothetical protein [Caudoviricetes sp.]